MKRKITLITIFLLFSALIFADFNPLSFVTFKTGLVFNLGEGGASYSVKRELKPFAINKYETTYELWYKIRIKAEKIGYYFENLGQAGTFGKYGAAPTEDDENQPVTTINWYDAIVWCNALSELSGKTPCYTFRGEIIRDSSNTAICDLCECDFSANGYRLPCESEWEYAARRTKRGFQSGSCASGQLSENEEESLLFAWTSENANQTRIVGTAGIPFDPNSVSEPSTGNSNFAGIYDMSGNVIEYCWDWFATDYLEDNIYGPETGYERVSRGGSISRFTPFYYAGDRYFYNPSEYYNFFGFRICYTCE